MLTGGFFFISSHRFAQAGVPGTVVGAAVTAWGVAYCLITLLVGKFVKTANTLYFILAGGILLALTSAGFMLLDGLYTQFCWLITAGVGAALFCAPFQIFAKSVEGGSRKDTGVAAATGLYTFMWSVGFATGPLAFARFSNLTGFMITLILALSITFSVVIIAFLRKNIRPAADIPEAAETAEAPVKKYEFSSKTYTRLAILGWIVGGLGTITICQMRAIWPKQGEYLGISREHIAYVLALVSYVQGITALLLCLGKKWMYRRIPAFLMGLCAVTSLLIFAFGRELPFFYIGAVIYGIYSGSLYFYLVFHSLSHPERSGFFVAGNEVLVGVTNMVSPMLGGLLADATGFIGMAFIFAAVMSLIAFIAQMIMLNPAKMERL